MSLCERHGLHRWQVYGRIPWGWFLALTDAPEAGSPCSGRASRRSAFREPEGRRDRLAQAPAFSRSTREVHSLPESVRRIRWPRRGRAD